MKFLIVDKSTEIRASIKKIINSGSKSHNIAEVSNYDDAFFCLYSFSPDYVIMDLDSLNGKGMMMLKSSVTLLPSSRVFLFTEFSENILKEKLIESGVERIFSKSSDTDNFIHELLVVLKNEDVGYETIYSNADDNIKLC
jgi:DNA-binding NarL/FixJ family response regulator